VTASTLGEASTVAVPLEFNAAVEYIDRPASEGHGQRTALVCHDAALTYAELQQAVNRFANAIRSLGVEAEQRVAILLPNRPEFVIAFYGTLKAGAVAAPVSFAVTPKEQLFLIGECRARALVTNEELWAPLRARRNDLPFLRSVILVDGGNGRSGGELAFDSILGASSSEFAPVTTSRDDAAFWLHTSGSTGTPKWAIHRHGSMPYSEQLYGRPVIGLGPDDVVFSGSPCFHAYSLGILTYFSFRAGATVVLSPERTTPAHMFELIERHRVTVFASVPTLYGQMLRLAENESPDLSSLRLCVSAAEALPAELYRRFCERFGVEILDGIGSTEALHTFISNRQGEVKPGSSGHSLPGYDIDLLDSEGRRVGPGEVGNLWVRGGSLFTGYWHQVEATRRVLCGEWYSMGDTFVQDEDGYFWYQGRSDDMLRVSGHWVAPAEVEATLLAHPAVLEAAVVGKRDADELVKPQAFVVLRDASAASDELGDALKKHVKASMAAYSYPRWIEFVSELPKTATGKIQRFKLREPQGAASASPRVRS